MQLVVALRRFAENRAQSQRASTPHQNCREPFIVRGQQQSIALAAVTQPLLFAGVPWQDQTCLPSQSAKHRLVFFQH